MIDIILIITFAAIVGLFLKLASLPLDGETPAHQIHARRTFNRKDR
jgi:hypothetical protein